MSRVLLIEDELLIAMMLEDRIRDLGHHVIGVAETEAHGLRLLADTTPDIALVDFRLADGECFELMSALQSRRIPFVLVTGAHIDASDSRLAGIEVLAKPLDMDRLTAVFDTIKARTPDCPVGCPMTA